MLIEELFHSIQQDDTIIAEANINLHISAELMTINKIGALPVVDDDDDIVGILSERDIVQAIVENKSGFFQLFTRDVMTRDVVSCSMKDRVIDIYKILLKNKIRHIPISENNKLVGMLSIRDFNVLLMKAD